MENIPKSDEKKDESLSSFSTAFTISFDDDNKREFSTKDPIRKFAPPKPNTIEKPRLPSAKANRDNVTEKKSNLSNLPDGARRSFHRRQSNLSASSRRSQDNHDNSSDCFSYSAVSDSAAYLIDRMLYGQNNNNGNSRPSSVGQKSPKSKALTDATQSRDNLDKNLDVDDKSDNGTYVVGSDPDVEAVRKQMDKMFSQSDQSVGETNSASNKTRTSTATSPKNSSIAKRNIRSDTCIKSDHSKTNERSAVQSKPSITPQRQSRIDRLATNPRRGPPRSASVSRSSSSSAQESGQARKRPSSQTSSGSKPRFMTYERSVSNLTSSNIRHARHNNTSNSKLVPASRILDKQDTAWVELKQVELESRLVNFGQGMPDYNDAIPRHIIDGLVQAVTSSNYMMNQYTRGFGHPRLIQALSYLYSHLLGRSVDAQSEILVSIGASEALHCIINAFVDKDAEVIIIEPYFDCYEPMVRLAGGKGVFIPLRLRKKGTYATSADWVIDETELEASVTPRTKMLILNTPHNPLGKVFSRNELEMIARICIKHDIMVLSDEVYEHLVIDGEHVRIAGLPGMWERTVTVGSAGKTFSVTGWKLGWCYGPKELMRYVQFIHQNCIYTCPTPLQEAVANSFETEIARMGTPESYWGNLAESLRQKRDQMAAILREANIEPITPEGGYFMLAETSNLSKLFNGIARDSVTRHQDFMRWLKENKKLRSILLGSFYSPDHKNRADDFIRLCYFKSDLTLNGFNKLVQSLLK